MRALIGGLGDVLRAPAMILIALAAMVLVSVPFAIVLGTELRASLAQQPVVAQGGAEIDADWWQDFVEHAEGIAATFTPMILGTAAPLDNAGALLDGTARPLVLFIPISAAAIAWAFVWGAALDRFANAGQGAEWWRGGMRTLLPFTIISLVAGAIVLALYYTAHPALAALLGSRGPGGRLAQYALFGLLLAVISVIADYARVRLALSPHLGVIQALRDSWMFVVTHPAHTFGLYFATALLFVLVLAAYLAIETSGLGAGWRSIAAGQAFIAGRVIVRLTFGAAELRLYRGLTTQGAS